jgi:hypothetical protein
MVHTMLLLVVIFERARGFGKASEMKLFLTQYDLYNMIFMSFSPLKILVTRK